MKKNILGVIPARYKSERLPGKPLKLIGNLPMIQCTYLAAKKAKLLDELVVLTDDEKIYNAVKSFGGKVELTPDTLQSGTDRAAYFLEKNKNYDVVVNIQGDEPFINSDVIDSSIMPFIESEQIDVVTPATPFKNINDVDNPAFVKVIFKPDNIALYFSRSPIPYFRNQSIQKKYYKHIGLYTYSREALLNYSKLPVSYFEKVESLEQLRMLENGYKIKIILVDYEPISVDTEEDLKRANDYFKSLNT